MTPSSLLTQLASALRLAPNPYDFASMRAFAVAYQEWLKRRDEAITAYTAAQKESRCESCDGTGDIVDLTGEYRGACPVCTAPAESPPVEAGGKCQLRAQCEALVEEWKSLCPPDELIMAAFNRCAYQLQVVCDSLSAPLPSPPEPLPEKT